MFCAPHVSAQVHQKDGNTMRHNAVLKNCAPMRWRTCSSRPLACTAPREAARPCPFPKTRKGSAQIVMLYCAQKSPNCAKIASQCAIFCQNSRLRRNNIAFFAQPRANFHRKLACLAFTSKEQPKLCAICFATATPPNPEKTLCEFSGRGKRLVSRSWGGRPPLS